MSFNTSLLINVLVSFTDLQKLTLLTVAVGFGYWYGTCLIWFYNPVVFRNKPELILQRDTEEMGGGVSTSTKVQVRLSNDTSMRRRDY
jgi:hypothetical protein